MFCQMIFETLPPARRAEVALEGNLAQFVNQASQRIEDTFDGKIPDGGTPAVRSAFLNFYQDNQGSATTNLARNPKGFPSDFPVYFTNGRIRDILIPSSRNMYPLGIPNTIQSVRRRHKTESTALFPTVPLGTRRIGSVVAKLATST